MIAVCPVTRRLVTALAVLLASGAPLLAQGADPFQRGEELYKNDRLLDAEKQFRLALETGPQADRPRCYDRLLAIYIRPGRLDRAITVGGRYEEWLRDRQPGARLRALYYELGWCYHTLGHHAAAESLLRKALEAPTLPPLPPEKRLA